MNSRKILVLFFTCIISVGLGYAITSLMSLKFGEIKTTVEIPPQLLEELRDESVAVAQHGYTHVRNLTSEDLQRGYDLLLSQRLTPKYYIDPYEEKGVLHPKIPVLSMIEVDKGITLPWDYSAFGLDNFNRKVVALHIQDDIEKGIPKEIFERVEIIRVDDVNTDIVPINLQVERIRILKQYSKENNKTLILGVIPYVPRFLWWYPFAEVFFRILLIIWVLLVVPFYAFYFLSRWLLPNSKPLFSKGANIEEKGDEVKLSVIMPAFNEEHVIRETILRNLEILKGINGEIIVVNDGSIDKTKEIVQSIAKDRPELKLINLPRNTGKHNALNIGIQQAKGEIIICSDADSYLSLNTYQIVTSTLKNNKVVAMVGLVESWNRLTKKSILSRLQEVEYLFEQKILRTTQFKWANVIGIPGPFFAFKKDKISLIANGGKVFEESLVEDFALAIRMNARGLRIYPSEEVVAYTHVPQSLSSLRRQRIRWFGGTLYETIRYEGWKFNPFYTLNLLTMFLAPIVLILIIIHIILTIFLFESFYPYMFLPFLLILWGMGAIYAFGAQRHILTTILLFPLYLWLLKIFRVEATLRVVFKRKLKWGKPSGCHPKHYQIYPIS